MAKNKRYTTADGITITVHAFDRASERANINGKRLVGFARKASELGLDKNTKNKKLQKFIASKYKLQKLNNIKIYGHFVYMFNNKRLINVLDLPEPSHCCWDEREVNI